MSIYLQPEYFFRYTSNYIGEVSDVLPVCCSIDNYFIPLFAGIDGTYIHHEAKKAIIYNIKEATSNVMEIPRTVTRFVSMIHNSKPRIITHRDYNADGTPLYVTYKVMKHFVYLNDAGVITPLYALCIGNKDIYTIDKYNPDFRKFFLLVNPLLFTPTHKFLAARLKPIIKYLQELHVNIMYSDNISDLCFRETTFKNTFRTIDERMMFVRQIKERVGLYVPPLPQSAIKSSPEPEPIQETIEVPEDQATGTIEWPDSTFIADSPLRSSTTVTGTAIPHNMYNQFSVPSPSTGWVNPIIEDWNAAAPQNIVRETIGVTSNGNSIFNNGVSDNTVVSASTHERVQAGFIDRSAFPVREVEMLIVDDLEPVSTEVDELDEQMAAMRAAAEVVSEVIPTGPRPDPSILNDPSLLVNTSTNIAF